MNQQIPVTQQIQQLTAQLNQKLLEQYALSERAKNLESDIRAIQNVLQGIGLGQALQKEIDAEQAKQAPATP